MEHWKALKKHASDISTQNISSLFKDDTERFDTFSVKLDGILFDYSKNQITKETRKLLTKALQDSGFYNWRDRFFLGDKVNTTEKRAVLHTALRQQDDSSVLVGGQNIIPQIKTVLNKMRSFVERVRGKSWLGFSDKPIEHIVHIGIGGSHLGPAMVIEALSHMAHPDITCDFVSNVDGHDINRITEHYNPETTLFIVASKSFTTQETMLNAETAKGWIVEHFGTADAVKHHFIALSTNTKAVTDFGIDADNMFEFWDWVGGRYSLWSAIGMPIALTIGMDNFEQLLAGAAAMDKHFKSAPLDQNIPVLMGLVGFWNRNILNYPSHVIAAYDRRLRTLPAWLQQLDMESNGKTINKHGQRSDFPTGPMVMGGAGTDIQHSFFQWIHQGTDITPVDFIICAKPQHKHDAHHKLLITHFLAQQRALMEGIENPEEPHRSFEGNRPSNAFVLDALTPFNLGQLLAAYEHKIFVQGVLWNINSFDQYGVELGKTMASDILENWDSNDTDYDSSTSGQLSLLKNAVT